MRFKKASGAVVCAAWVLGGCAIHQTVKPVARLEGRQVCIIENPAVRAGFIDAYKRSLAVKGYTVRQLPPSAAITECPTTSTYSANWRWDMAMYMSHAEIKVFSNGQPVGQALYDSTRGGANMNKFIEADRKIDELVNQLFPGGAGI
ncbi:MAG TPA: Sbal_3080 family lipoprotein [Ramlibacter sp.]|uniref:Sbal_3080 family lipoprotein n=1 Tax=Ramlibacter sp. TaxID=1917967 RepID=UPI002ED51BDC